MKTWKIVTIVALATVVVALLASTAYGHMGGNGLGGGIGGMMGRGEHMGGYGYGDGYYTNPQYPAQRGTAPIAPYQDVYPYQFGGSCHGFGRMDYGHIASPYIYTGEPLNIATASTIAQNYVASINNPDLAVVEVDEYSNSFYVRVAEKSTGIGAFELTVDKYTGTAYPMMGPSMMWNTKYGMMRGGILGGIFGAPASAMTVTASQAAVYAQQFLDSYYPNTAVGDVANFYGYYTVEVLSNGSPTGMLSVNGYTGQVYTCNWVGSFIQELDLS